MAVNNSDGILYLYSRGTALQINSSANATLIRVNETGNVGIRTASPDAALDVDASTTSIHALKVRSGSTYGLYVSTAGKVGIGLANPQAKLEVYGPPESKLLHLG